MTKIPIIVNPFSKRNKKMCLDSIEIFKNIGSDFIEVKSTESIDELQSVSTNCMNRNISFLIISGGDGTIHQVLTQFINIYRKKPLPAIVILKDGTMNNISGTVGNRGNGYDILKRFIKSLKRGDTFEYCTRYTMRIGERYCFLFGSGLTTNILNAVYSGGNKDLPKVVRVIAKAFIDGLLHPDTSQLFKRFKAQVFLNQEEIPCNDFLGILAGTVEDIGMGFRPLTRSEKADKTFHAIATGVKPIVLAKNILALRKGKRLKHPLHYDRHVGEIRIKSNTQFEYTMDGDMYVSDGEVKVTTGPEVRFVRI